MKLENNVIEISISKKKVRYALLGSIVFVCIGFWFVLNPPKINNPIFGNTTFIFVVGLASIIFFSIVAITLIRKLLDNKPGLVVDEKGIFDNSSGISAGLVLWNDVSEISLVKVMRQSFLMIIVKNPSHYIERQSNFLKKKMMQANYKTYGSPIAISSNSLETDFDNLCKLLIEKFDENK